MNILIFSWRDIKHPLAGGAEQVMHEHAKGWIGAGHQVTHFSSRFKRSMAHEVIDGIEIIRRGYQYFLGVQFAGFIYYLRNKKKFDLVIDEFHGIPFFTPLYVRKQKLAVIQETARKVWFLNPFAWPINWIIGVIGYITEPFIFLLYKNVVFMTGSNSAKEDVIKMGVPSGHITIIPHGVIVPKASTVLKKEEKKTVVFLGKLSKDKGVEDAIKCFSILNKKQNFQFWIVGKSETNQYEDKIKKMVRKANLGSKLKFWGFVSEEKKFELLSKAHILINPSVREGWGLVNIEANSVGTPVVAYKSAGLVDSVNDGVSGIFCREKTPQALTETLDSLLTDTKRLAKINRTAIFWSKQFLWAKARTQSLKLIGKMA